MHNNVLARLQSLVKPRDRYTKIPLQGLHGGISTGFRSVNADGVIFMHKYDNLPRGIGVRFFVRKAEDVAFVESLEQLIPYYES